MKTLVSLGLGAALLFGAATFRAADAKEHHRKHHQQHHHKHHRQYRKNKLSY